MKRAVMKTMNMISLRLAMARLTTIAVWITSGACLSLAWQSAQPTFPSAAVASQSLFQAVQSNNEQAIADILGGQTELTSSQDPGLDKVDRELFVQKYQEMHRLRSEPDGSVNLYIGAENWPFPIPLVKDKVKENAKDDGAWRFDLEAGRKEVMFRRIGENELMAIANCREFAAAKHHHAESGTAEPAAGSPVSSLVKAAGGSDRVDPLLFQGYYFRLLPTGPAKAGTAGFALIAYPSEYRSSGVMTFIVTKNGVVYEKDLGEKTSALASGMAVFRKDPAWRPAGD
jgi:Protein of unknown function (DUF2950)